jgi:hypothetical protein
VSGVVGVPAAQDARDEWAESLGVAVDQLESSTRCDLGCDLLRRCPVDRGKSWGRFAAQWPGGHMSGKTATLCRQSNRLVGTVRSGCWYFKTRTILAHRPVAPPEPPGLSQIYRKASPRHALLRLTPRGGRASAEERTFLFGRARTWARLAGPHRDGSASCGFRARCLIWSEGRAGHRYIAVIIASASVVSFFCRLT